VGKRVKLRKLQCGLSPIAFATRLGVSPQLLRQYESGEIHIGCQRLYEVTAALDTPIVHFFIEAKRPISR